MARKVLYKTSSDTVFDIANYMVLSIFLIACLYPIIYILSASISSVEARISGRMWLFPVDLTLIGYKAVFNYPMIWTGYANSLFYMGVGTLVNVALTVLAAYPLSRKDLDGRNVFMFLFVFTMFFRGGLIPTFITVQKVGILNTRWALIFPLAIGVWNVIITRTYFQSSIPYELLESAKMDGCSDFRYLWKIVLPLSKSVLAVITLFYAVQHWNQYFWALIFLDDKSMYPLQLVLRSILVMNEVSAQMITLAERAEQENLRELLKFALIVVACLPVLIVYPFVQKHFVKGIIIGSLKG